MTIRVAIPKETTQGEQRVAVVPQTAAMLQKAGCTVLLQRNAGIGADYPDKAYQGVEFCDDAASLYQQADVVLKVAPPSEEEMTHFKKDSILIGLLNPFSTQETLQKAPFTSFALELLPRIS